MPQNDNPLEAFRQALTAKHRTHGHLQVLPGTGRGTARSAVEGVRRPTARVESPLHYAAHVLPRDRVPPPRS